MQALYLFYRLDNGRLMHNTILQAIKVAIQKSTFIPMSCDDYPS